MFVFFHISVKQVLLFPRYLTLEYNLLFISSSPLSLFSIILFISICISLNVDRKMSIVILFL